MPPIIAYDLPSIPPKPEPVTAHSEGVDTKMAVISAIEDTLELSSNHQTPLEIIQSLDREDQNTYLSAVAHLLKAGVVGTETLDVRGQPYTSFVSTRFVDPQVTHARSRL